MFKLSLLMGNIYQNNINEIDLEVSLSEYWDLYLSRDVDPSFIPDINTYYDNNLISLIDINNPVCVSGDTLYSNPNYIYGSGYNSGLTLNNIGLTGIDNGLILFDKDVITTDEFNNLTNNSILSIEKDDLRLILSAVSGNTGDYIYPYTYINEASINRLRLDGGFFQGFFKHESIYSILPDVINKELSFNIILKPDFKTISQEKTLNYNHIDNKGFILYIGTRAENKFIYDYNKNLENSFINTKTGITYDWYNSDIYKYNDDYTLTTDNKFLIFNRTLNGRTVYTFNDDEVFSLTNKTSSDYNKFLYYNRLSTGSTVYGEKIEYTDSPYNIYEDLVNNSIGFRIKDDGSIGYRMLNISCNNNFDVLEEYSEQGIVKDSIKTDVVIRLIMSSEYNCNQNRTFKIYFYVNSELVFISKSLPELLLRKLNDDINKQESVPYCISLGGGTQGLSDVIGFNSGYTNQYMLPIEKYFSGTFIGDIYKFSIFNNKYDYSKIKNNYDYEFNRDIPYEYIEPTIDFYIVGKNLTEPETDYKREYGNFDSGLNANITLNKMPDSYYKTLTRYKLYYYKDNQPQSQLNGIFSVNPYGGAIPEYIYTEQKPTDKNDEITFMIEVFDKYKTTTGNKRYKRVEFDNMIFFGNISDIPSTSDEIRALYGRAFNKGTTDVTLETGIVNTVFVVALPSGRRIDYIIDEQASFVGDISLAYQFTQFNVMDAGGNYILYDIYYCKNTIPYSESHNHKITLK